MNSNLATATHVSWNVSYNFTVGEQLTVIGYGTDFSGGGYTDTLEYANLTYITNNQCQNMMDNSAQM